MVVASKTSNSEKRFVVHPVYLQAFLQRVKFLINFLKSLLKNKTKLKYWYRQKIAKYCGTGTTKVPTVPVPRKYRGIGMAVL